MTGEKRAPLKITYTTDTRPLDSIVEFAKDADLFICEGMYGDREKKQSMEEKGHMLMQDACELAKRADAKDCGSHIIALRRKSLRAMQRN